MQQGRRGDAGLPCHEARVLETCAGVLLQVGIVALLDEDLAHALEDARVDVARALAEVRRDLSLDLRDVHEATLVVDVVDHPDVAGDGELLPHRRRHDDRSQLLALGANGVLLALDEDAVEAVVVGHALAREAHDEATGLGALDVLVLDEVAKQRPVVVLADVGEGRQREDAASQLGGRELPLGGERRHGLVVEQAVAQAARVGRLDPAVLDVELDERDALEKLPGDGLGHHGARLGRVLAHDEPHLGGRPAPPRATHALQEARDGEGGVELEGTLQLADVDAQLERGGGAGGEGDLLVAHEVLGRLAEARREVAVVDEEAVGLAVVLAVAAQGGRDRLALLARVGEDQALATLRVLVDVADARVGVCGCRLVHLGRDEGLDVGRLVDGGSRGRQRVRVVVLVDPLDDGVDLDGAVGGEARGLLLGRLRAIDVEVLHRYAPADARLLDARDHAAPSGATREDPGRRLGVADGGRQADAARADPRHAREALHQAERLCASVAAHEGVDLVDDDEAQVAKERGDGGVAVQQHRLERLGRYLQDAAGLLHEARLVRRRDVTVPVPHGDVALLAEVGQAIELIVDEGLERPHVDAAHRGGRVLPELGEDGKEGRLGLARGRRRREQDVLVGVEDRLGRGHLDGTQRLPLMLVDEVLHERREPVECPCHGNQPFHSPKREYPLGEKTRW